MDSVLVTGGAGFIGSNLVHALVVRGDQVRVLDDFSTGRIENLAPDDGSLEIFEGDLRDNNLIRSVLYGVDYVYHLAAFVSSPKSILEPLVCYDINVGGTLNLLEASKEAGVRQVIRAHI